MKKQSILCLLLISLVFLCSCSSDSQSTFKNEESYKEAVQVDYKTLNNTTAVLMFKSSSNNKELGDLYIKPFDGDEEKIASNVYRNQYELLNNNDVVYIDSENNLYLKKYGQESVKIDKNVPFDSVFISSKNAICYRTYESDNFLENYDSNYKDVLIDNEGNSVVINIYKSGEYNGNSYYYFSDDGETLYCLDYFNTLSSINLKGEVKKLAGNVYSFVMTQDGSAFAYSTLNNRLYIKWSGVQNVSYVDGLSVSTNYYLSDNGLSCILEATDNDFNTNLYFITPFNEPIIIFNNSNGYKLDLNNQYLYTLDENNSLYGIKLPNVASNTKSDNLVEELDKLNKVLIGKEVKDFSISHDGKSVSYINLNNELYTSFELAEAVKIQDDIDNVSYINGLIVYQDKNSKLFINEAYNDMSKVSSSSKEISSNSQFFFVENNALDYYIYMDEKSDIYIYSANEKSKLILDDVREYNSVKGKIIKIYEKTLSLNNIKGMYICENNSNSYDTFAIEITRDYITIVSDNKIEKKDITLIDSTEDSILFTDGDLDYSIYQQDDSLSLEIYDDEMNSYFQYKIKSIGIDDYNKKFEKAKLEMKYNTVYYLIEDYYKNNYQATEVLPLYLEHNLDSIIIGSTIKGEEYDVLNYYVEDDYDFWLYVEFLNSEGVDFAWIYIDTSNFTI